MYIPFNSSSLLRLPLDTGSEPSLLSLMENLVHSMAVLYSLAGLNIQL